MAFLIILQTFDFFFNSLCNFCSAVDSIHTCGGEGCGFKSWWIPFCVLSFMVISEGCEYGELIILESVSVRVRDSARGEVR